jgi:hypothetical protein
MPRNHAWNTMQVMTATMPAIHSSQVIVGPCFILTVRKCTRIHYRHGISAHYTETSRSAQGPNPSDALIPAAMLSAIGQSRIRSEEQGLLGDRQSNRSGSRIGRDVAFHVPRLGAADQRGSTGPYHSHGLGSTANEPSGHLIVDTRGMASKRLWRAHECQEDFGIGRLEQMVIDAGQV